MWDVNELMAYPLRVQHRSEKAAVTQRVKAKSVTWLDMLNAIGFISTSC